MSCPPDHSHGETGNCYGAHGCRCADCYESWRAYMNERARRLRAGTWKGNDVRLADAEPARKHLRFLYAHAMTQDRVEALSGVPQSIISAVTMGQARTRAEHVERICKVPVDPDGRFVLGAATCRTLRALMLAGWSQSAVQERTGLSRAVLSRAIGSEVRRVEQATETLVLAAAQDMFASSPPMVTKRDKNRATFARNWARKHGYAPLAAYDDIHNIRERPKGVVAA